MCLNLCDNYTYIILSFGTCVYFAKNVNEFFHTMTWQLASQQLMHVAIKHFLNQCSCILCSKLICATDQMAIYLMSNLLLLLSLQGPLKPYIIAQQLASQLTNNNSFFNVLSVCTIASAVPLPPVEQLTFTHAIFSLCQFILQLCISIKHHNK